MAEPIQVDFGGGGNRGKKEEPRKKPILIPPERAGLKVLLSIIGTVLTAFIGYYVMLPPLNFKAKEFYYYIGLVLVSFVAFLFLLCSAGSRPEYMPYVRKTARVPLVLLAIVVVFFGVNWAFSSPFFHARRYSALMPLNQEASFVEDIQEPNFSEIPRLDKTAAQVVANRTLGGLGDYKSQFVTSATDTQINYKQTPVRVVTLQYADIIKWLTNTRQGLPGYVVVDMANEKSQFMELEYPIRYTDAEHFNKLLKRHLRFQFPTAMFDAATFEIDDEGKPYWIAPVMDKTIGLLGGEDVVGIVLVDAVTGGCIRYSIQQVREDKSLQWIDRVYSAELLTAQYNYYGKYNGGFWNSLLGQKNVTVTSAGYNYLAQNDDVYMYTGITSVKQDQSIYGFIMVNQRTKEANYYHMAGGMESAAEEAAQGLVSAYRWTATFPLLINVGGQPTYFLSLKDDNGVVQGYSMVNVGQTNKIKVWSKTLAECSSLYFTALQENGIQTEAPPEPSGNDDDDTLSPDNDGRTVTGRIADIRTAVIDGNTMYYFSLDNSGLYYAIAAKAQPGMVLLNVGDTVTVEVETPAASSQNLQTAIAVLPAAED